MAYSQQDNIDLSSDLIVQEQIFTTGNLELLLDSIAEALIKSPLINTIDVQNNQKFIRDGKLQAGQGDGVLALFQKDVEANVEDNLTDIANTLTGFFTINISEGIDNTVSVSIQSASLEGGVVDITNLIFGEGNPLNVSQFIPIQKSQSDVDVVKANEFLYTNIFELLPEGDTRQSRIVSFFQELNALLPPNNPEFGSPVNRNEDGDWRDSEQFDKDNSVSYAQENTDGNIDEEEAYLHRLKSTSNDTNSALTIQDIYDRVVPYLTDLLEEPFPPVDDRPEYENQSSGYLKFRNLNQGIIIRNTNKEFVEGLDPNNPTWLTSDYQTLLQAYGSDTAPFEDTKAIISGLPGTGFTITMWVKFLDKTSQGTLFNYGNPQRLENPFGFKLETYVVDKDDEVLSTTYGDYVEGQGYLKNTLGLFQNSSTERFVRLQVREFGQDNAGQTYDPGLRSSEVGNPTLSKFTWNAPEVGGTGSDDLRLLNNANIPEDFNEWYFICASYNPAIIEPDSSGGGGNYNETNGYAYPTNRDAGEEPLFWTNHLSPVTGNIVANTGYGNKCKVEIISRTDLLRARGFKV
jgi:hypothetical protein